MRIPLSIGLLLIVLAGPASAEWSWVHPQPQGHTLYDIVFLDNTTAIAVGEFGTVIVTHDTGDHWIVKWKVNGLTTALRAIDRLDGNTAVAVGDNGVILLTSDQGATWTAMPSGTAEPVRDVAFFDDTNGIAIAGGTVFVGGNTVLRSSDGGLTWQAGALPHPMFAVDMTSATNAIAVGDWGRILHTANGGATWTPGTSPVVLPAAATFMSVDFVDPLHGAIGASTGTDDGFSTAPARCYVTSDGGTTWSPSTLNGGNTNQEYFPNELLYPQANEVVIAGRIVCCATSALDPYPSGEFASTVNSGGLWTNQAINRSTYGLARNGDGVVMVVGEDGRILRRNLDATYTHLGPDYARPVFATGRSDFFDPQTGIVFTSDGTNIMFGSGVTHFARTNDGGQTWLNSTTSPTQCLDIAYLSASEIIAVGIRQNQGAVLRSVNGGATWSQIWTGASPSQVHAVVATSSTEAVAVGTGGNALLIKNGLVAAVATGGTNFSDVAFAGPSTVLAVGGTDARSLDGGLTWTPIVAPATGIRELDFLAATRAVGFDADGILLTLDAGSTWAPVQTLSGLTEVSFFDAEWGVVVGNNGLIRNTFDGGDTWYDIESPTTRTFSDVTAVAPDHLFASTAIEDVLEFGEQPVPTLIRALDVTPHPFGVDLRWDVTVDDHLAGFTIRRTSKTTTEIIASDIAVNARSYRDDGLPAGATYEYQLIAVDRDGSHTQSAPVTVTIPRARVELLPNQPNPFNPATTIRFVVPEKTSVQLTVHDVAGRAVATLVDGTRDAGMHTISWNADGMASGVYFARLRAGKTEVSQKMVLLK